MGDLLLFLGGRLAALFLIYCLWKAASLFYGYWTSTVRLLPGPPSPSFLIGNEKEVFEQSSDLLEKWAEEYGPTIRLQSFLGMTKLYTTDLKAINHVLMDNYTYQKPEWFRYKMREVVGDGLIVAEEDTHKRQRRILNRAFGPSEIRRLTEVFLEKSLELRDIWEEQIRSHGGTAKIETMGWLNRATLDIIGLAGFNYKFDALAEGENSSELHRAFAEILANFVKFSPVSFLRAAFPSLRWLPSKEDASIEKGRNILDDVGRQLIATGKQAIHDDSKRDKSSRQSADLLTILLRANTATGVPDNQKLSDQEIRDQIPTFMAVGHETSSTSTIWALYALIKHPEVQTKLRNELLKVSSDNPSMDELNALPYLDAVLRETLRLLPPLPYTFRIVEKDDVLPLSKPVRDRSGKVHESIHVQKGQMIIIPITPINKDKKIWGEDGHEFRPERWDSVPDAANAIPGVWGNSLAFFGGPRSCIGYRFAVMEMKALIFTLIRVFEFEPAGTVEDIGRKFVMVERPFLKSDPEAGTQMPLKVRLYENP